MYPSSYTVLALNIYSVNCFGLFGFDLLFKNTRRINEKTESNTNYSKWIEQSIDHFNQSDERTFKLTYFENLEFWKQNGPIYLLVGGESGEMPPYSGTIMWELAEETNGAMLVSEHRYYGTSQPFPDVTVENLAYLSSRQALADVAHLLETIKSDPKFESSKVVALGGSYAGNLAAWIRLLYPNLVDAAISSSAPVLAKKDFYECLDIVNDVLQKYGPSGCIDKIRKKFSRYEALFQSPSGIERLKSEESICADNDMSLSENRHLFFFDKSQEVVREVQYNIEDIDTFCNKTTSHGLSPFRHMFWMQEFQCNMFDFNLFFNGIKDKKDFRYVWFYQMCTEFGYFKTTSSDNQPFTKNIPVDYYFKMCETLFGSQFNEQRVDIGVDKTNKLYGGLKPNVTNVVFVNGDVDPWHKLGIVEDISEDAPAILIPKAYHCEDMSSDKPGDSLELKEARKKVKKYIKKWIGF